WWNDERRRLHSSGSRAATAGAASRRWFAWLDAAQSFFELVQHHYDRDQPRFDRADRAAVVAIFHFRRRLVWRHARSVPRHQRRLLAFRPREIRSIRVRILSDCGAMAA